MLQGKYNQAKTVLFPLITRGAVDFNASAGFATGDTQIIKNEGAPANTTNNPVHEGNGIYSLALTAAEMQAARIVVTIIDQSSPKVWEDQAVLIETYGNASAEHALDLDVANVAADVKLWRATPPNVLLSGRVDASAGAVAAGAIDANAIAADAIQAGKIAPDAIGNSEIADGALTAAKFAPDAITNTAIAADAIGSAELADSALNEIADRVLNRPISNVEPAAVFRTLYGAVCSLVNRRRISGSNLEIYGSDDATLKGTLAITSDPAQQPIQELDTT